MVTQAGGNNDAVPHPRCAAMGEKHAYIFMPQMDITAAELALSMELVMYGIAIMMKAAPPAMCDTLFAGMDTRTRLHWQVKELSEVAVAKKKSPGIYLPPGAR